MTVYYESDDVNEAIIHHNLRIQSLNKNKNDSLPHIMKSRTYHVLDEPVHEKNKQLEWHTNRIKFLQGVLRLKFTSLNAFYLMRERISEVSF
jgi:hypothetical protein